MHFNSLAAFSLSRTVWAIEGDAIVKLSPIFCKFCRNIENRASFFRTCTLHAVRESVCTHAQILSAACRFTSSSLIEWARRALLCSISSVFVLVPFVSALEEFLSFFNHSNSTCSICLSFVFFFFVFGGITLQINTHHSSQVIQPW